MKKTLFIIGMLLCVLSLHAQNMRTLFIAMPDSVAPLLTKVNREDFVDFLASNMKAEVKNRFGKPSELKKLSDDYLFLQTTERSTMEMKLLPLNDSVKVICVINTICAPACDSKIRFYNTQWQELAQSDFIQFPSAEAFYLPVDTLAAEAFPAMREKADMELVKVALAENKPVITFVYTTPDYLAKGEREKLAPYLKKEPIVYEWKEGKFMSADSFLSK